MIRDIGSIFPLYDKDLNLKGDVDKHPNRYLYGLCREAIYDVVVRYADSNKHVLLPAYTCGTVVRPFEQAGWKISYYAIQRNLRIDIQHLSRLADALHPAILLVHPYFGQELCKEEVDILKSIKEDFQTRIIVDLTQSIFVKQRYEWVDYYVGSIYKWLPTLDGGFLETKMSFTEPTEEHTEYVQTQRDAMYLRGLYFENGADEIKSISRRINGNAKQYIEGQIVRHTMSTLSRAIWANSNMETIANKRMENYRYLRSEISGIAGVTMCIEDDKDVRTAPLYLPVYCDDRLAIQSNLAQERIYAPILWPIYDKRVLINDVIKWIYEHILVIPIDQRCSLEDMERIIDVLKK